MEKKDLLKYLTDCKELELTIYNLQRQYELLRSSSEKLAIERYIEPPDKDKISATVFEEHDVSGSSATAFSMFFAFVVPTLIVMFIAKYFLFRNDPWSVFVFIICLLAGVAATAIGGFFIGLGLGIVVSSLGSLISMVFQTPEVNARYKAALTSYNEAFQREQARVNNERMQKQIITSRMQELNTQITETTNALKQLYAVGIVYKKYQALVPIVMFCEYIESGRCDALEGHEGAYNIYENELRQNIIISKLDVVINKLDQIRQNQYMLAAAIEEGNRHVAQLCSVVQDSAQRLERIETNSVITAENARIAAKNTYVIGQLETYRILSGR